MIDIEAQKKKLHTGFKVSAKKQRFWINQYIVRNVKGHLYFPLRSILSLILYISFFLSLLLYDEPASWLGVDIKKSLADYPYIQNCYDENCTRGFTFDKRFSDVGNIEDIQEYFRKLFVPKVFPSHLPYFSSSTADNSSAIFSDDALENIQMFSAETGEEMHHVYWDANIRRVGPVVLRQVLAEQQECRRPTDAALARYNDPARTALFKGLQCYISTPGSLISTFDETPMERPSDSQLPEDAYIFKNSCVEGTSILGRYDLFPCSGYSTEIHNASQMLYAQEWLNPAAKLVVISVLLRAPSRVAQARALAEAAIGMMNNSSSSSSPFITIHSIREESEEVRIDLYIEQAPGGGGSQVWNYVNVPDQRMFSSYAWMGFTNLGIDLAFFLFHTCRYLYYRFIRKQSNRRSAEQHRPEIPWINVLTLVAIIWLSATTTIQVQLRESWMLAVLVVSTTSMLMYNFVFPVAKIITYRALTLIRSLTLAMRLVLVIIPFYAVITIGFVFSGHLMFGRNVLEYSTLRLAVQTIGRGLLTDWNIDNMYAQRPLLTMLFCVAFFAVILVVLANLLLTLITAAVDEAKQETQIVNFVQMAAEFSNKRVYTDEYVSTRLAWHLADHHILARAWRRIKKRVRAKWRTFWKKYGPASMRKNPDEKKKSVEQELLERRAKLQTMTIQDFSAENYKEAENALLDAADGDVDQVTEEKVIALMKQIKDDAMQGMSAAVLASEKELEEVLQRDERGGQFFVSGSGRFARPLESLMYVCSPFRLQELAETLHLTEIAEDFIYSVALLLARSQMDFVRKFPDQFTLDDTEGARLMHGFRVANLNMYYQTNSSSSNQNNNASNNNDLFLFDDDNEQQMTKTSEKPNARNDNANDNDDSSNSDPDPPENEDEVAKIPPTSPKTIIIKKKIVGKKKKPLSASSSNPAPEKNATYQHVMDHEAMMDDI